MSQNYPLCTIFVTYYNTGNILFETIDSVLSQDYPEIELIISDDASARVPMPMDEVESYVQKKQKGNIRSLVVRRNKENIGTVKHVELIHELSQGEYCCGIAGDDLFGDEHVISTMVSRFEELGQKAEYMIGQVEMFDQKMEKSYGYCVQKNIIKLLKNEDWEEVFNQEVTGCKLVGQCMCRTSLFKRMPKISDNYTLVEDYSTHMWLLHNDIPIYWCDILMVKHRGGGMSHGNLSNKPEVYIKYCRDYMTVFEEEIEPYRKALDEEIYKQAVEAYRFFIWQHDTTVRIAAHPVICKFLLIRNPADFSSRERLVSVLGDPGMSLKICQMMMALLVNTGILCILPTLSTGYWLELLWKMLRITNIVLLVILFFAILLGLACLAAYRLFKCYRRLKPTYY